MDKCKLVLDDDIEISLPIEEYLSGDKVEKVKTGRMEHILFY